MDLACVGWASHEERDSLSALRRYESIFVRARFLAFRPPRQEGVREDSLATGDPSREALRLSSCSDGEVT
jgi:hypothetical protein